MEHLAKRVKKGGKVIIAIVNAHKIVIIYRIKSNFLWFSTIFYNLSINENLIIKEHNLNRSAELKGHEWRSPYSLSIEKCIYLFPTYFQFSVQLSAQ